MNVSLRFTQHPNKMHWRKQLEILQAGANGGHVVKKAFCSMNVICEGRRNYKPKTSCNKLSELDSTRDAE